MDNNSFNHEDESAFLKELTLQDFRDVGLDQIAYIKQVENVNKTAVNFSIHAADGSQISVMDSYDMALAAVRMSDLYPVTLH
jgi:hypothetical protein